VAEASVTIPDIVYVVDCGFVKMPNYSPTSNIESLSVRAFSPFEANGFLPLFLFL
jgi:HrpA-like RNA helicase